MPSANFNPLVFRMLLDCALTAAAFVFFCLMAGQAAKRQQPALHWIVPMLLGFGLFLFASLSNLLFWAQWQSAPRLRFPPPWYVNIIQYLYPVALACLAYGAFRLWQAMPGADDAATVPPTAATPQEGVWPPAPTRAADSTPTE
ncbi:MAG: hypothetical protein JO250_16030 [Armatimonadetes bacterium]|nr:hypothetical protein [Armatimonadota bacterium]